MKELGLGMKLATFIWLSTLIIQIYACGGHHHQHRHLHLQNLARRQAATITSSSSISSPTISTPASSTISVSTNATSFANTTTISASTASLKNTTTSIASSKALTSSTLSLSNTTTSATPASTATVRSNILVIARDQISANQATSGLNAYGIPFQTLIVPASGAALPVLNTTLGGANFGGIIVVSDIAYYYDDTGSWRSALTDNQWKQLYAYQITYGVRMVQYDVYPQAAYGVSVVGSCCDSGVEQMISLTNTTAFSQAGLRTGAGMTTSGLFHYLAQITDTSTTTEIAQFAANSVYSNPSTAGVINNFNGREQMVFFISWATDWSPTSNFLQHAFITWMTRGLYAGIRRVNFVTQIDDMMLPSWIYYPGNSTNTYRVDTVDMSVVRDWVPTIQAKMNPGSWYKPEIGHNGNGNIIAVDPINDFGYCDHGPIYVDYDSTPLEFQKPLGTGTDGWPSYAGNYSYTNACLQRDNLTTWMSTASNRDAFLHLSHTFTHEGQNNATYSDISREISWNQKWFKQTGISNGNFTANGIIPPAITGLHNGDALRAWYDNGIRNAVGDNSRSPLRNQQNYMWPYITNMANNGFDGIVVIPRWAIRIYYNCDTPACTTQEWIDTSAGSGDFTNLMAAEKADTMRRLFGLYHDGYMFHQLNLRTRNMTAIPTADGTRVFSLFQAWVEQAVQEFKRLANWPMITLKQADLATSFVNRMTRDACGYSMSWKKSNNTITGITVYTANNTCSVPIPVTVPGPVTSTQGFATEQHGNDPLTIWVKLTGKAVTFTLSNPIALK